MKRERHKINWCRSGGKEYGESWNIMRTEASYGRRKRARPKVRWLDDFQEDLREMGIEGWRIKAQDRDQWRRIAQETKAHVGL
jgi:hypothetical protein